MTSFKPVDRLFFRASIQGREVMGVSLHDWLARADTELILRANYPRLAKKAYPLENKWESLQADTKLMLSLQQTRTRLSHSTVARGPAVMIGSVFGGAAARTSPPSVTVDRYERTMPPSASLLPFPNLEIDDQTLLQTNPLLYLENGELIYVRRLAPTSADCQWQLLSSNRIFHSLLTFCFEPKTGTEAFRHLSTIGIDRAGASELLRELSSLELIFTEQAQDRFAIQASAAVFSTAKAALASPVVPDQSLVAIARSPETFDWKLNDRRDLELASRFVWAVHQSGRRFGEEAPLEYFRRDFVKLHDTASVPILSILHPYKGFAAPKHQFPQIPAPRLPSELHAKFLEAIRLRKPLELTTEDLQQTIKSVQIPEAKAIAFTTSFFVCTNGRLHVRKIFTGVGVRPVGRFLQMLGINASDLVPTPVLGIEFVEVGGVGDIKFSGLNNLQIGSLRYISFANRPRLSTAPLSLRDLWVQVRGRVVWLWDERCKRFVVPIMSNALNPGLDAHPASKFLRAIEYQFHEGDMRFRPLPTDVYVPEVRYQSIVLSAERQLFSASRLLVESKNTEGLRTWLRSYYQPGTTTLLFDDSPQEFFVELDSPVLSETIRKLCRSREFVALSARPAADRVEFFQSYVNSEEPLSPPRAPNFHSAEVAAASIKSGHELVVSFVIRAALLGQNRLIPRLAKSLAGDRWYYVRFHDDGPSLRLRVLVAKKDFATCKKKIARFLSQSDNQPFLSSFDFKDYAGDRFIYNDLSVYHRLQVLDSKCAARLLALSADDPQKMDVAAWVSVLSYAQYLGDDFSGKHSPTARQSFPKVNDDDRPFMAAKAEAIRILKEKDSFVYRLISRREPKGLQTKIRQMNPDDREFLTRRMIHLTLNRFKGTVPSSLEPRIFHEASIVASLNL